VQTRRLHESFEGLNSSPAYSRVMLSQVIASRTGRQWKTCFFCSFAHNGFLCHNFSSRHARRSIKGSWDGVNRLVFTKPLSHKNGLLNQSPWPVKVIQECKNMPSLW